MDEPITPLPLTSSRPEQIFPTLTPDQIRRIAIHGQRRKVRKGESLVEQGDKAIPFFVVLAGDLERDADVQNLLDHFHIEVTDIPVVICRRETVLRNPTNSEIANCLGFNDAVDPTQIHDVVIVGAGPAGLAAAVYGASEGLDVL